MNYYISDLHFNCINKYENRTLEHDKLIIDNWNKTVHQNDNVYILGDIGYFSSNKYNEYLCQCLSVLKGNKTLILGNHDNTKDKRINQLFVEICDYKEIIDSFSNNKKIVLSHYPILMWNGQHNGWIHLHGHTHMTDEEFIYRESIKKLNDCFIENELSKNEKHIEALTYNVGCMLDYMDYTPRTLKYIMEEYK